jgi:ribonuclease HIII
VNLKDLGKYAALVGSDEAGKGEWLGPLTIAAVALSEEQSLYLVTQGVIDSKKLRLETILELAKVIRSSCLNYHVITISPQSFNRLMERMKEERQGLNDILAWGHSKAIANVLEELVRKGISGRIKLSIDMFDKVKTEKRLKRVLDLGKLDLDHRPKAEEETSVAAASIIARSVRELWIDVKSKELKTDLRKLSTTDAKSNPNIRYFAKVNFLK